MYPALYYNGRTPAPLSATVQVSGTHLFVYAETGNELLDSCLIKETVHNRLGNKHFLYLHSKSPQCLELDTENEWFENFISPLKSASESGIGHRLMRQKVPVLIAYFAIAAIGLYFLLISLVPFIGARLISVKKEIEIGNSLMESMLLESSLLGDTVNIDGSIALQRFADTISLSNDYPIKVTLISSDVVNAFALPGGQIAVYSGLLKKIKSPEELAALLSHEAVHVNQRHSLKSMLRSVSHGILISIIFGDVSGISGVITANIETLQQLHYSRSLEAEADYMAMELLQKNKLDTKGMQYLLSTLEKEASLPGFLEFISSHPLTQKRIEQAKDFIQKKSGSAISMYNLKPLFDEVQKSIE